MDLEEEMLRIADEIGHLKQESRHLKKRVVMAEEAARKAEIKNERQGYEKLDVQIQFRTLATAVAKLAKQVTMTPTTPNLTAMSTRRRRKTRRTELEKLRSKIVGPILRERGAYVTNGD